MPTPAMIIGALASFKVVFGFSLKSVIVSVVGAFFGIAAATG